MNPSPGRPSHVLRLIGVVAVLLGLLGVAAGSALAVVVEGVVASPAAVPISGALVELVDVATQDAVGTDTTNAQGRYGVDVPVGTYDLVVTPAATSGFLPQTLADVVIDGNVTLNVVLVPAQSVIFRGTMVDDSGVPLPGQTVSLHIGSVVAATSTTDANGAFSMVVFPGAYSLQLTHGLYGATSQPAPLPLVYQLYGPTVSITQNMTFPIVLETRVLRGSVVGPGSVPIAAAAVVYRSDQVAFGGFFGVCIARATSDAAGGFSMDVFPSAVGPTFTGFVRAATSTAQGAPSVDVPVKVVDDVAVVVTLDVVQLSGTIVDRNGTPVPNQHVGFHLVGTVSDAQGAFSMQVAAGLSAFSVSAFQPGIPTLPDSYRLLRGLNVTGDTNIPIVIENRMISGTVTDAGGLPVPNAVVRTIFYQVSYGNFGGDASSEVATDTQGNFALPVLVGSGELFVSPAPGKGFRVRVDVPDDISLPITVPTLVELSGIVADDAGSPLAGQKLYLAPQYEVEIVSDAQGHFALEVVPGDYQLNLEYFFDRACCGDPDCCADEGCCGVTPPDLPSYYDLEIEDFPLTQDVVRNIVLPVRRLTGTVVDADGVPVPNVSVEQPNGFEVAFDDFFGGSSEDPIATDAGGRFVYHLFPSSGGLYFAPPDTSGLISFLLEGIEITDHDVTLGVLLQFAMEQVTNVVGAGATVTTDGEGDGATPSDPIETAVTTPNAGSITIRESPLTTTAPSGFRFLTQQIDIVAPPASPGTPLVIVFKLDATRIPPNVPPHRIDIFKNGVRVQNCVGAPGTAVPDPCVLRSPVTGDLTLTVLTSTASAWNFGFALPKPLDAFACYKAKLAPEATFAPERGVLVTDTVEPTRFDLTKVPALCSPAALDGSTIADPEAHLTAYALKLGKVCSDDQRPCASKDECAPGAKCGKQQKSPPSTGIVVRDALGSIIVDLGKPATLLAPSAVAAGASPVFDPEGHTLGHFKCYDTALATKRCVGEPSKVCASDTDCGAAAPCFTGFAKSLSVGTVDGLVATPRLFDVKKPTRHCRPAVVGTGAIADPTALQCYAVKPAKGVCANTATSNRGQRCSREEDCGGGKKSGFCVAQAKHAPAPVSIANAFGTVDLETKGEIEVCLPSVAQQLP